MTAILSVDPKTPKAVRGLVRKFKHLRRQAPFATSLALTDTAFDVRHHIVRDTYPKSFAVKNQRFAGVAFRVKRATKHRQEAHVFDRMNKSFLRIQNTGGTKRPNTGRYLAVPIGAKRLQSGRARIPRNSKTFVADYRNGSGQGIFQRYGRGGKRTRLLFALKTSTPVRRAFPFFDEAEKRARSVYPRYHLAAWRRAIATARL